MNKSNNTNQTTQWGAIGGMIYARSPMPKTTNAKPKQPPCYIPESEIATKRTSWYNTGCGWGERTYITTNEGSMYIQHPTITGVHIQDMHGNSRHCSWVEYKSAAENS